MSKYNQNGAATKLPMKNTATGIILETISAVASPACHVSHMYNAAIN